MVMCVRGAVAGAWFCAFFGPDLLPIFSFYRFTLLPSRGTLKHQRRLGLIPVDIKIDGDTPEASFKTLLFIPL